ncbi:hypothetical protein MNB_SV-4-1465 [hydrothermal vent metagenome]|uniref:L,D-TPase catalytic domain-containing protein n=1 Tax=hydrothermal vent metagenome TaxID=652676 RepID=A0A1W1E7A2_9ZZZZ
MSFWKFFLSCIIPFFLNAQEGYVPNALISTLKQEVVPLGKTLFEVVNFKTKKRYNVHLKGKDFVLVSVREPGSDGRFYAVDKDGTVWLSGSVSSGAAAFRSPSGVFRILRKKKHHMSSLYPDESGMNNMEYMMQFTPQGHALHQGSVDWMSHGCIHIAPVQIKILYRWVRLGMPIVITRHSYMSFAKEDLIRIY